MASPDPLHTALFLIGAFVPAGMLHTAWLASLRSHAFAIPLDGGRTLRGRRILGDNKGLRGFLVMTPAAAAMFALLHWMLQGSGGAPWPLTSGQYALLGAWAGFGFMAGELPNSFVKRQLDVAPGTAPANRLAAALFFVVDRVDSIVGMLLALACFVAIPAATWGWMLLLGPAIHGSFSVVLHRLGVKARPA